MGGQKGIPWPQEAAEPSWSSGKPRDISLYILPAQVVPHPGARLPNGMTVAEGREALERADRLVRGLRELLVGVSDACQPGVRFSGEGEVCDE